MSLSTVRNSSTYNAGYLQYNKRTFSWSLSCELTGRRVTTFVPSKMAFELVMIFQGNLTVVLLDAICFFTGVVSLSTGFES